MNDDDLLKPREVAEMLGVRPATIGFWARTGVLKPFMRTPRGQRRYRRGRGGDPFDVIELVGARDGDFRSMARTRQRWMFRPPALRWKLFGQRPIWVNPFSVESTCDEASPGPSWAG